MGGEQKLIEEEELMRDCFFTMIVICQMRKTVVFGKTRYVVRIAEHCIKFSFISIQVFLFKFRQECCYWHYT